MASKKSEGLGTDGMMLGIHLDVGHSSIGWAVSEMSTPVIFRGCGTVLFPKDGCLASERRANRRQRRHIRSTRRRISRLRALLDHLNVLAEDELRRPGCAWPWKLAAEALAQGRTLTWPELWDVLRWYAHNRGYDGNAAWQRERLDQDQEETRQSLENARLLMDRYGTQTMAETVCAVMGVTPGGARRASMVRYKAAKASFPRRVVESEVSRILTSHVGKLPCVDELLMRTLTGSAMTDPEAWRAVPCPEIQLPARYAGGLLFGQLVPRFDNRIIGRCPVSGDKRPLKSAPEFLEYRWAMFLANIRVGRPGREKLTASERQHVTTRLREEGYFGKSSLKKALKEVAGVDESNVDDMLLVRDAENALVLYPAMREVRRKDFQPAWDVLPNSLQRRVLRRLAKGKSLKLEDIRGCLENPAEFDAALDAALAKGKKKAAPAAALVLKADFQSGRAPYSRSVMTQAVEQVMEGNDPRAEGGVLYATSRAKCLDEESIDRETNNHLLRNRLRILRRLVMDIIEDYAHGDKSLIGSITLELNREVKELSGKTAKQIASDLGLRIKNHTAAVDYASQMLDVPRHKLGGSLIRKVRIAMDLDWTCPYTKEKYDIHQLRDGSVDLDHVIPRSQRTSDSLDSLVVTFKAVNAWKSNATAMDFVHTNGGKPVPGMPSLSIITPKAYEEMVQQFKMKRFPHEDDQKRRDNRCKRMMTRYSDEKEAKGFTPRDLTMTSHLTTLAAAVLRDIFADQEVVPPIRPIPGSITHRVRMGCDLMGKLALVNPLVLDEEGQLKNKTEIRDISHLHHAVDAMTLGLASTLIPTDGDLWAMMLKRKLEDRDRARLEKTGAFQFDASGRHYLRALDAETLESVEKCLCQCRVATHIRASKRGATLEKTIWGIVAQEDGRVTLRQRARDEKTGTIRVKLADKVKAKGVLGLDPVGASKLKPIKGAIVISDNFGVALDPEPEVIPYHHVWRRLGEIKKRNNGQMPRVLRNGMIIRVSSGGYKGVWKIFSVKDASAGIMLDMGAPDVVTLRNKTQGHRINVLLKSLMKNGMEICPMRYTGVCIDVASPD